MTVPTLKEFTEYLNFPDQNRPENTVPPRAWAVNRPGFDEVKELIVELLGAREVMIERRSKTNYAKWVKGQLVYQSAIKSAFRLRARKRRKVLLEEADPDIKSVAHAEATRFLVGHPDDISSSMSGLAFLSDAERCMDLLWHHDSWGAANARVLFEYFYSDHAKNSIKWKSDLIEKGCKAKLALEDLSAALRKLVCADPDVERALHINQENLHVLLGHADRFVRAIDRRSVLPIWMRDNPLERKDTHAKEQLLVFRYCELNRRWGKFPACAVRDLMYLDGIEHQYNERTIERLYAKFTGKK